MTPRRRAVRIRIARPWREVVRQGEARLRFRRAIRARALRTSCSAITVDSAKTLYLVLDANGLRLEGAA